MWNLNRSRTRHVLISIQPLFSSSCLQLNYVHSTSHSKTQLRDSSPPFDCIIIASISSCSSNSASLRFYFSFRIRFPASVRINEFNWRRRRPIKRENARRCEKTLSKWIYRSGFTVDFTILISISRAHGKEKFHLSCRFIYRYPRQFSYALVIYCMKIEIFY